MALVVACALLATCRPAAGPRAPTDESLVVALENAPIHLDPRVGSDYASGRVFELILEGLVEADGEGSFVPGLATSWEVLDDGYRWRFHLREGVEFHDGRPFTAADVIWTFGTMLDGTVASPKRGALAMVESVESVESAEEAGTADPLVVDFRLTQPYGALLPNLTSYLGIVPAGRQPEEFGRAPVGTGPFRFVSKTPDRVVLAANDRAWRGRPVLDRLEVREVPDATVRALELRKGTVHLVVNALAPDVVSRFRNDPEFRVVEDPGSNYVYLSFNLEDPILSDVRVRRAFALAIDRQKIVDSIWNGLGVVTESLMRPGHWARHDGLEPVPHDPAAAQALLDEAGYPDPDGEGPEPRFTITYKVSTDETSLLQAQIIQAMLARVGIGIEIRSFEFATFYEDIKRGNFQLFSLVRLGIADPDIYQLILHSRSVPPAGANRGRYVNPEFDRLIELGARFADPAERRPHYLEAQEIFARDLPYVSLFIKVNVAVMPTALEGYRNYPSGQFYGLREVRWRR